MGLDVPRDQGRGRNNPAAARRRLALPRCLSTAGCDPRVARHVDPSYAPRARRKRDRGRVAPGPRCRAGSRRGDEDRLERRGDDRGNGPATDHRASSPRRREPRARDATQHAHRAVRPPPRRRARSGRGLHRTRPGSDDQRIDVMDAGVVPVEAALTPKRSVRRIGLRDGLRRHLPHARCRGVRGVRRRELRDLRARLGAGVGLPRRDGLGRRILRLRMAAARRSDLARRHAPVREPARRDRARDGVPRRAAKPVDACRLGARDRRGLRRDQGGVP